MCSLRDAATDFAALNVRVYGVSRDDVRSIAAFVEAQKLSFPLLSDPDGSVTAKYGIQMKDLPFSKRVTFVLDGDGRVRLIDDKVDVASHGSDLAERIRQLQQ